MSSSLTFFLFFVFVFAFDLSKPRFFVQLFFDVHAPRQPHAVVTKQLSVSSFVLFLCFLGDVAFSEYYVPLPFFFLYGGYLVRFLPDGVFLLCDHGLDFDVSLCENSIKNQIIYHIYHHTEHMSWAVVLVYFNSTVAADVLPSCSFGCDKPKALDYF